MKYFSNLSIAIKIVLLVSLLGVIAMLISLYSMINMKSVDQDYTALISNEAKSALVISEALLDLSYASRLVYAVLTEQEKEKIEENLAVLSQLEVQFSGKINTIKLLIPQKNIPIQEIESRAAKVFDAAKQVVDAASRWRGDKALLIIKNEFEPDLNVLQNKMDGLRDDAIENFTRTGKHLSETTSNTILTTAVSVNIALLLVLALSGYVAITQISRPIRSLSRIMGRLTLRNYDDVITDTERRDEVGAMAKALQIFKDTMQHADKLELEAAASAEAKRLSEKMLDLTDAIPGAVFQLHVRPDGWRRFLFVSEKTAKLLGRSMKDLVEFKHPVGTQMLREKGGHQSDVMQILMSSVQTLEPLNFDLEVEHDGKSVWLKTLATVRRAEDGGAIFNGVWLDVSDAKRQSFALEQAKQAAEQAAQAKSSFLAMMSHEIRTPMNAVIGMVHLAQRTELTEKQRNYLSKIDYSAHALLNIINDILDFSKIEAGQMALEKMTFSIEDLLASLSDVVGFKAEQKNIEIIFSVAQDTPRFLVGDSLRLGQILINLVSNAVKFTEHGEIVVSVMPEQISDDATTLRFDIRDTGIGMTSQQMEGLFRSFSQADTSITRKYGGTGLGLAISKQLAEMMGGRIWVESETGVGSIFSFTGHFGIGEIISPSRVAVRLAELRGKRILIVDDNDNAREVLSAMLDANGFTVASVSSGEQALTVLSEASRQQQAFDLVLMDWRMPKMDGIETSRRIKSDESLSLVPSILMVTAFGREEIMALASDAGLDGFLIKPVNESILVDTIVEMFVKQSDPTIHVGKVPEQQLSVPAHLSGRRILLVEDNPFNRDLATELLSDLGMVVEIAENGRIGVEKIHAETFDLVFMDIQMPEMDGLTATRMIRTEERFDDLPIVAMTAHAMSGDKEKSLAAGMNDHLTKPIDPEKLTKTLTYWLAKNPRVQQQPQESMPTLVKILEGVDIPDDLPPFDIHAALLRTNGKRSLVRRLILSFRERYEHAAIELRGLISQARYDDAERLAHTLKGIAATLGAEALRVDAEMIERSYQQGNSKIADDLITSFESSLAAAIQAAASLLPPTPIGLISQSSQMSQVTQADQGLQTPSLSVGASALKQLEKPDFTEISPMLAELRVAITDNNLKARKLFVALKLKLQPYQIDQELVALASALDGLQFVKALEVLDALLKKINPQGLV